MTERIKVRILQSLIFALGFGKPKSISRLRKNFDIGAKSSFELIMDDLQGKGMSGALVTERVDPQLFKVKFPVLTKLFVGSSLLIVEVFHLFRFEMEMSYEEFNLIQKDVSHITPENPTFNDLLEKIDNKRQNGLLCFNKIKVNTSPIIHELIKSGQHFSYVKQNHGAFDSGGAFLFTSHKISEHFNLTLKEAIWLTGRAYAVCKDNSKIRDNWSNGQSLISWIESMQYEGLNYYLAIAPIGGEHHTRTEESWAKTERVIEKIGIECREFFDGVESKDIVYKGEFINIVSDINSKYDRVLVVGPKELSSVVESSFPEGIHIEIPISGAVNKIEEIERNIIELIDENLDTIVLYQAGFLASIWSYQIHKKKINVSQLDLGLTLGCLEPEYAGRFPWYSTYKRDIERIYTT